MSNWQEKLLYNPGLGSDTGLFLTNLFKYAESRLDKVIANNQRKNVFKFRKTKEGTPQSISVTYPGSSPGVLVEEIFSIENGKFTKTKKENGLLISVLPFKDANANGVDGFGDKLKDAVVRALLEEESRYGDPMRTLRALPFHHE